MIPILFYHFFFWEGVDYLVYYVCDSHHGCYLHNTSDDETFSHQVYRFELGNLYEILNSLFDSSE